MPEGPTISYYKENLAFLKGKTIKQVYGYAEMKKDFLLNKKIINLLTYGKHLIIKIKDHFVSIHLGMVGDILINERLKVNASFGFVAEKDEINGYVVRVKKYDGEPEEHFDWRTDIMHPAFDEKHVLQLIRNKHSHDKIEDTLMNQSVFTGVGNIIKNEVLFRCKVHPENINNSLPLNKLKAIINDCRTYGQIFFERLHRNAVHKETDVYKKEQCPKHKTPLKIYISGKMKRKNFVCEKCQILHANQQTKLF